MPLSYVQGHFLWATGKRCIYSIQPRTYIVEEIGLNCVILGIWLAGTNNLASTKLYEIEDLIRSRINKLDTYTETLDLILSKNTTDI